MIEVYLKDNTKEEFEAKLTLFKKLCNKDGFLQELKERQYYSKPSEIKRRKKLEQLRNINKSMKGKQ